MHDIEEMPLDLLGHRSAPAAADGDAVDAANGRDLRRGAGEEDLVGAVEHLARHGHLLHRDAEVAREAQDAVAGDAGEQGAVDGRRDHGPVGDDEHVLAGAFAQETVGAEGDRFGEAVGERLHLDELSAQVVAGDLRDGGDRVGGDPLPRGDARIDAVLEGPFAEVGAPGPAGQVDLHGARERDHAGGAVAADHHGPEVAGLEPVLLDEVAAGGGELVEGVGDVHPVDATGDGESLQVGVEAEDGGAARGVVAANALEDGGAVLHGVREDVDVGIVPANEFAVAPDPVGRREFARGGLCHSCAWVRGAGGWVEHTARSTRERSG